jgi:putative transposase
MKKSRFSETQIFEILKESEAGAKPAELCRKHGISLNTLYKWRSKFGGMTLSDLKRLRELEDENGQLRRLVAQQALDIQALRFLNSKKF